MFSVSWEAVFSECSLFQPAEGIYPTPKTKAAYIMGFLICLRQSLLLNYQPSVSRLQIVFPILQRLCCSSQAPNLYASIGIP